MTINVTQEHIAKGFARNCRHCPVALAIRDAGFPGAEVLNHMISPRGFPDAKAVVAPAEVTQFIAVFDCLGRDAVRPFSFELEATP